MDGSLDRSSILLGSTKKERTFVYQMKVRFFIFIALFGQIMIKLWMIRRCGAQRDCRSVIFMPTAAAKRALLFIVLCSNKE